MEQSSVYLIDSDGQMLCLPIPSNSPRDPLNMGKWTRRVLFLSMIFFGSLGLILTQTPALIRKLHEEEFTPEGGTDVPPIHLAGPASTLFTGVGVLFWTSLCIATGRRPVMILCSLLLLGGSTWAAFAASFSSFLAALCLIGLATGAFFSVCLLIAIDVTFVHERPTAIAILWSISGIVVFTILAVVPLIMGAMGSWRLFYGFAMMPCVINFLLMLFCLPETFFLRPPTAFNGKILVQKGDEKITLYDEWYQVPGGRPLPESPLDTPQDRWGRLKLALRDCTTNGRWKAFAAFYPQLICAIFNPLLFWVTLLNVLNVTGGIAMDVQFSQVLSGNPYNLSPQVIPLVNLAAATGALLALPAGGPITNRLTRRLTARNGGVRDAEHYLPAFVLPVLSGAAAVVLFSAAAHQRWHWIWIYVAFGLNGFSCTTAGVASTLWVTEAFPQVAAAALAGVVGVSYLASFGVSCAAAPWVLSQGDLGIAWEIGVPMLLVGLVAVPISFWGKGARQYIAGGRWSVYTEGALRPQ